VSTEIRVGLFNADAGESDHLRRHLGALPHVKIVTECVDIESVSDVLRRLPIDVLVVNLDPRIEKALQVVEGISTHFPAQAIIGLSTEGNPDVILSALRAGCRQFVQKPIDCADLAKAFEKVGVSRLVVSSVGKKIAVIGTAGGCGATTVACNLAIELSHLSDSTSAIVDLHLEFGDVAMRFDLDPRFTLFDVAHQNADIDEQALQRAIEMAPCNVAVLGRPRNLDQVGQLSLEGVVNALGLLSSSYATVVVDCPRSLDRLTLACVEQADVVLLVLELTVAAVRNASRLYEGLLSLGTPEDRLQFAVNRYRRNFGQVDSRDVEEHFGRPLYAILPNDYTAVSRSLDKGHALMADAPNSPIRMAMCELAKRLLGSEQPGSGKPGRGSLLSRIFTGARPS
jgi:pilus assembly protein CpaE